MNNIHLVYATANVGKIVEIRRHFGFYGIPVSALSEFSEKVIDPEETGHTLRDNAFIKAQAYAVELAGKEELRDKKFIVVADDTGVEISGLGGEPGIRVRRWIGRKMSDEELISYTLERMRGLTGDARKARFRTALCMITVSEIGVIGYPVVTTGSLDGRILDATDEIRIEGFPFESIFYVTEYDMLLGELHRLPDEEKRAGKFNHRERAIENAVPMIKKMMKITS